MFGIAGIDHRFRVDVRGYFLRRRCDDVTVLVFLEEIDRDSFGLSIFIARRYYDVDEILGVAAIGKVQVLHAFDLVDELLVLEYGNLVENEKEKLQLYGNTNLIKLGYVHLFWI